MDMTKKIKETELGKVSNETELMSITINEYGEKIYFKSNDSQFLNSFMHMYHHLQKSADEAIKKIADLDAKNTGEEQDIDYFVEFADINLQYSQEAVRCINSVFGEDTVRKYFKSTYEYIPNYVPGIEPITKMLEQITTIIEKAFNTKIADETPEIKPEIGKYHPQDYRPGQRQRRNRKRR